MKKYVKILALTTIFGTLATGCQKETNILPDRQPTIEQTTTTHTIRYIINGQEHLIVLHGREEYSVFVYRMLDLAEQGQNVTFGDEQRVQVINESKESVTYTTKDKNDANNWCLMMALDGYSITIRYDESTGIYTCTAYKE